MDEDLKIEQREIETYVQKYNHPPEPITVKDQNISFAISISGIRYRKFSTIAISESGKGKFQTD